MGLLDDILCGVIVLLIVAVAGLSIDTMHLKEQLATLRASVVTEVVQTNTVADNTRVKALDDQITALKADLEGANQAASDAAARGSASALAAKTFESKLKESENASPHGCGVAAVPLTVREWLRDAESDHQEHSGPDSQGGTGTSPGSPPHPPLRPTPSL